MDPIVLRAELAAAKSELQYHELEFQYCHRKLLGCTDEFADRWEVSSEAWKASSAGQRFYRMCHDKFNEWARQREAARTHVDNLKEKIAALESMMT